VKRLGEGRKACSSGVEYADGRMIGITEAAGAWPINAIGCGTTSRRPEWPPIGRATAPHPARTVVDVARRDRHRFLAAVSAPTPRPAAHIASTATTIRSCSLKVSSRRNSAFGPEQLSTDQQELADAARRATNKGRTG
jgi:hypothetical protein